MVKSPFAFEHQSSNQVCRIEIGVNIEGFFALIGEGGGQRRVALRVARSRRKDIQVPFRLTNATLMSDHVGY